MNWRCFQIGLSFWLVGLLRLGWAESFPNRPSVSNMEETVRLGTECVHGVNERCYATQYKTNPVAYLVTPPFVRTNEAIGWHLGTNALGRLAVTSKALVPWNVDSVTVYDHSTNMAMLTVMGVWTNLQIGDSVSKFTITWASGTNAATYGDSSPRVRREHLGERYQVLNALKMTRQAPSYQGQGPGGEPTKYKDTYYSGATTYSELVAFFGATPWFWIGYPGALFGSFANRNTSGTFWEFDRHAMFLANITYMTNSNLQVIDATIFGKTIKNQYLSGAPVNNSIYYDGDYGTTIEGTLLRMTNFAQGSSYIGSMIFGNFETVTPQGQFQPNTSVGYNVLPGDIHVYILWQFKYCRDPL